MQSHDYIAMERLHEIHASGRYDLIVVDTPPTRNAIDFLDAPTAWPTSSAAGCCAGSSRPTARACVTAASKPFYTVADRILGAQFLQDIAEFFILFQTMYDGFVERAQAVTRTLAGSTHVVRRRDARSSPRRCARPSSSSTRSRSASYHLGAVVLNRVLPAYLRDPDGRVAAERHDATRPTSSPPTGDRPSDDRAALAGVLREVADSFRNYRVGRHPSGRAARRARGRLRELVRYSCPPRGRRRRAWRTCVELGQRPLVAS